MISKNSDGNALNSQYGATVRSSSRQFRARIMLDGQAVECDIKRIEIERGSCASLSEFKPGTVMGSSMTAELCNLSTELKHKKVRVDIGMLIGDTYEYITEGYFVVTEVKKTVHGATVTGNGAIVAYGGNEFIEPATKTLGRIKTAAQVALGVSLTGEAGIDNNLIITAPLQGITAYQALEIMARAIGGYVTDVVDGAVRLCRYKNGSNTTVTTSLMKDLPAVEEANYTVTGVRCTVTDAYEDGDQHVPATGFEQGDPINLDIKDQYMTQEQFDFSMGRLIGYTYRPGTIRLALGDPRIEATDNVTVQDADGTSYVMNCHRLKHIYDGGFSTEIESAKPAKIDSGIGSSTPLQRALTDARAKTLAAKAQAARAEKIASDTAQYFWFTGEGTDTGAHITEIPQEQFLQDPTNGGGNLLARSNGIAIRDGLDELAAFTQDAVEIGPSGSGARMTADSFEITKNQWTFFEVKDLAGEEYIETQFKGDGNRIGFGVGAQIKDIISVTVEGTAVTARAEGSTIMFTTAPSAGANIVARWTTDAAVPALSFGKPLQTGKVGTRSAAFGQSVASGDNAFAEGRTTRATGVDSHAEGRYSAATGGISHAEGESTEASGSNSHAEGYSTIASGEMSHAEGEQTEAIGAASHAGGAGAVAEGNMSFAHGLLVKADGSSMTAFGRCNDVGNTTSSGDNYALVVGNGIFDAEQQVVLSNADALTLDWQGNLSIAGTLSQASDRRLKEHVDYLGDDAVEFVRALKPAHYRKDGQDHVGLYAQDVAEADRWDCMTDDLDGYMTLSYTELIAPLVAYCQHLEKRIKALEDDK